jgi:hypothetical protein
MWMKKSSKKKLGHLPAEYLKIVSDLMIPACMKWFLLNRKIFQKLVSLSRYCRSSPATTT